MSKLVIANWKMHPSTELEAKKLFAEFGAIKVPAGTEAGVCPPETYIALAAGSVKNMELGAQNVFWDNKEAATGEVSPAMLKDLGVKYVITGHSERRAKLNEDDAAVWRKTAAVVASGMTPILCVGEPLAVRRTGEDKVREFLLHQLTGDVDAKISYCSIMRSVIIAYEPVWAISTSGTGMEESPEDAVKMINFIREILKNNCNTAALKVIYGGSVNADSAPGFLRRPEIDGALVGRASLNADEFQKILNNAVA